jgi:hypothetical protein
LNDIVVGHSPVYEVDELAESVAPVTPAVAGEHRPATSNVKTDTTITARNMNEPLPGKAASMCYLLVNAAARAFVAGRERRDNARRLVTVWE